MQIRFYRALKSRWMYHMFRGHTDISKKLLGNLLLIEMEGFQRGREISLLTYASFLNEHIQKIPPAFFFYWTNETFLPHCNNQYKLHDAAFPKIEMPAEHTAWCCFQEEQGKKPSSVLHKWEFWRLFFIPDAPGVAAAAASSMRSPSSNSILLLYSTSFSPDLRWWLGWKKENIINYYLLSAPFKCYGT